MFPYTRHHPPTITLFPYTTLFRSPEYMIKDIPPTGTIDIEKPQIYFGEAEFPNVIANSKVDEFDYPAGQENMSTRFDAEIGRASCRERVKRWGWASVVAKECRGWM